MVSRKDVSIKVEDFFLIGSIISPNRVGRWPVLVICHGMPSGKNNKAGPTIEQELGELSYIELAEWCAWEGFLAVVFNFRGTGNSGGNFSHMGWTVDLHAVLDWLIFSDQVDHNVDHNNVYLLGSSLGGAVAIHVGASRKDVAGVISFASPASMSIQKDPERAISRMRDMGIIRDYDFPSSIGDWAWGAFELSPVKWIHKIPPRPLLLMHGDADTVVSPDDVFLLAKKAQGLNVNVRLIPGVGHRFRSEPKAIQIALEWLKNTFVR